ncbi:MAG TPA: prolyl oligopeptidase family serine peptidase [Pyrinomonadaceae bacterium]|nr:prolyl oligopeptidase family serine peptidase [Pyrinomonadaceae bacterium]
MTKFLLRAIKALIACTILCPSANAQKVSTPGGEEKPLIQLRPVASGEQHDISLKEIVERRRIRGPRISPDGKAIAFIIEQAFLERNERGRALFVVSTDSGGEPVKLLEEESISSLQWVPNGKYLTYLSSRGGSRQIWRVPASGGEPEQLFSHPKGVSQYELSPNGKLVAFIAADTVAAEGNRTVDDAQGIVFNRSASNGVYGWVAKSSRGRAPEPVKLWIYDLEQRKAEKLEQTIRSWRVDDRIGLGLEWSPDSRKLAVHISRPANESDIEGLIQDIWVFLLDTRTFIPLITWGGLNSSISWSSDSNSFAFLSEGNTADKVIPKPTALLVKNVQNGGLRDVTPRVRLRRGMNIVGWSKDGSSILLEAAISPHSERGLYQVNSKNGELAKLAVDETHLSALSISSNQTRAACVRQEPATPPEVAVVNLENGDIRTLTALHPEYQNIRLIKPIKLVSKNKFNSEARNYLLKPADYVAGNRYPLVVILYAFSGDFLADKFGNYPIQPFAANGLAVLCVSTGGQTEPYHYGNFDEATRSWAYDPLATIEEAVQMVAKMGIVDEKRVGIMGWSYGSFLSTFAITQTNLFSASSSGDGSLFSTGTYWNAGIEIQKMYDGVLGGGPFGHRYKNWQQISPMLNADRVRIPILLETTEPGGLLGEIQFHTAIEKQGGKSELVIYRNAIHEFNNGHPKQSFYSMQLNLDWFNFWLQGREDPDPAKREQYVRWRAMRNALKRNRSASIR